MSKKRTKTPPLAGKAVTPERAGRLYRLLKLLGTGPKTRGAILKRLRIDIRTFYRDLELLRDCQIDIQLQDRRYSLAENATRAVLRLPFPDPSLTLGEAKILAKGTTAVHRKLKTLLAKITR